MRGWTWLILAVAAMVLAVFWWLSEQGRAIEGRLRFLACRRALLQCYNSSEGELRIMVHRITPWFLTLFLFVVLFSACTSSATSVTSTVEVPTLAVLPSDTPIPSVTDTPRPTATSACSIRDWWEGVEVLVEQFLDTAEVAAQTSRIALGSILLQMRQIERQFERGEYPECARTIYRQLSNGMDSATQGFNYFLGESEAYSRAYLGFASQYFWNAYEALRQYLIFADVRLSDTSVFIWGGDSPNAATATAYEYSIVTIEAGMTATRNIMLIPTELGLEATLTAIPTPTIAPEYPAIGVIDSLQTINLRTSPSVTSVTVGVMSPGEEVTVIAISDDKQWYKILLPGGQEAWLLANLVNIGGPIVSTPMPNITSDNHFEVVDDRTIYLTNPSARGGCNWSSIAGSAVNLGGTGVTGYSVRVTGEGVDQTVTTGSAPAFGPGGFEVPLGSVAIERSFIVQLLDPQGRDVSPAYTVETSSDCGSNIAAVRFVEVAQSS